VLPLSTLVILVVALLRLPVGHLRDGQFHAVTLTPLQLICNVLLVQNITHTESIVAPLWSLPYEMQMYLALPFLFLLVRRCRTVFPVLVVWAVTAAGTLLLSHSRARWLSDIIGFAPYFMVGVVAYQVLRTRVRTWPFFLWPFILVATTLTYLFHPSGVVSLMCCVVLGLAVMRFGELSEGRLRATFRLVARYSYGIYLSHFILIWLAFCAFPTLPWSTRWLLLLVTSVAVPVALYHYLEAPMIALGARLALKQKPSTQLELEGGR
jgi:peptidoglycan/LPS O-acetylase OafA/YrhL